MAISTDLIEYFKQLGLDVHTTTKARGHLGFFLDGRIDISKNTPKEKLVQTLLHEFSHYIHSKIEKNIAKTGGSLNVIFDTNEDLQEEMLAVTKYIDEYSKCERLFKHKQIIKNEIKILDEKIKQKYPKFQRSKPFKEFNKAIKGTKIKYLLKYDKVLIKSWLPFSKDEFLSINTIEKDFPNLKQEFIYYLRLKSLQRKQKRVSSRIFKIQKYYKRPTELFARFVEALYVDNIKTKQLAPNAYNRFYFLLDEGYYQELKNVFKMISLPVERV